MGDDQSNGQSEPEPGADVDERAEAEPGGEKEGEAPLRQKVVTAETADALEQEYCPPSFVTKTYPNAKALPEPLA